MVEAGLRRERERLARKRSLLVVFREAVQFGAPGERFDLIQDTTIDLGDAEVVALARAHIEQWKRPGWTRREPGGLGRRHVRRRVAQ